MIMLKTRERYHSIPSEGGCGRPVGARSASALTLALMIALASAGVTGQTAPIRSLTQTSQQDQRGVRSASKPEQSAAVSRSETNASRDDSRLSQKITREGVAVEFSIDPVAKGKTLLEGEDHEVRFRVTDERTSTALTGLRPSAWIDSRRPAQLSGATECRQKIQAFLQASLSSRPDIDLNTYYILAMNEEPNISVIDPLFGYGSSKLLTMVMLKSPGEDWALTADKRKLFVSMPSANQVAVVDTTMWKVLANIDAGPNPVRLALQKDEKYLWVGNDSNDQAGGVTAIDVGELRVKASIKTGAGHQEIALDPDDRRAFVASKADASLSVIDVQKLMKVSDVKVGEQPASVAFSPLSKAVYVANEADGTIAVVGGPDPSIISRLTAEPGLKQIRFTPDGRWGFAVGNKADAVHVLDSATNRFVHHLEVGKSPDKVSFTKSFAYVRSLGTEQVTMIQLDSIGKPGSVPTLEFPGGQIAPETSSGAAAADSIVQAPEGASVLVANPADKIIYYYSEGMAAPMGSFKNYGREPRAVLVCDRGLRETRPGVYSTTVRLTGKGDHDVAFLLDSPRVAHCFDLWVRKNPALRLKDEQIPLAVRPLLKDSKIQVGETVKLEFEVRDPNTRQPKTGLKDLSVLVFLSPGVWQRRQSARPVGEGRYEVTFAAPQPGVYYVFVRCPSLRVQYNQLPHFTLDVRESKEAAAKSSP